MQTLEGQVDVTTQALAGEPVLQPYARPTVETLDVSGTRNKAVPTPESLSPAFGS